MLEENVSSCVGRTAYTEESEQTQTIIKDENLQNNLGQRLESTSSCGLSQKHASQLSSSEAKYSKFQQSR